MICLNKSFSSALQNPKPYHKIIFSIIVVNGTFCFFDNCGSRDLLIITKIKIIEN